ncbi:MAG: nucleotidyltransferase domain-containing protein [Candidatus Obscuribacterales bacterium]|nr:nucleotidyltransferase domain-containing protein [Candidatus Obscuribacterales bacterium]
MQHVIDKLDDWCQSQPELKALAIIGSYGSGKARPDSDLDLLIVTVSPDKYLGNTEWISAFGTPDSLDLEDYKLVQSWRVIFADGSEVEFCITTEEWCSDEQIKDGTGRIVSNGILIVYDPDKILESLVERVRVAYVP